MDYYNKIPLYQWFILGIFLILIPFGTFTIANDLSNGQVFIEQEDPEWEKVRQGVYNNTIIVTVGIMSIVTTIFITCPRGLYEENIEMYNSKGERI